MQITDIRIFGDQSSGVDSSLKTTDVNLMEGN